MLVNRGKGRGRCQTAGILTCIGARDAVARTAAGHDGRRDRTGIVLLL